MRNLTILLLVIMVFPISQLYGSNYYVSLKGNDHNDGRSLNTAFLTLQHSVEVVQPGDSVYVTDGEYKGFDIRKAYGTIEKPIVYKAMGNNVVINSKGPRRDDGINVEDCSYVVIDGFIVKNMGGSGNGIRVVVSTFCTVRNCWCDHNAERGIFTGFTDDILIEHNRCSYSVAEHGIYVSNSSDRPIVLYNECWENNAIGIHMNGDLSMGEDGINHDAQIYGNYLHDNHHAAGINLDGVLNPLIYNNVIVNNHEAQGIALFNQDGAVVTHGAKIFNNTIVVPTDGRWGILLMDGAQENTEIYNNIIINEHSWRGAITAENTKGLKSDYNLLSNSLSNEGDGSTIPLSDWQALGLDPHSVIYSSNQQLFNDRANGDFSLAQNSVAIDEGKGTLVFSVVNNDYNLSPRPSGKEYDLGAYEFQTTVCTETITGNPLKVYPNPASDVLIIEEDEQNVHFEIINLAGQTVGAGFFDYKEIINVESLLPGIYLLKTMNKGSNYCQNFIITNH